MVERTPPGYLTAEDLSAGSDIRGVMFVLRVTDGSDVGASAVLDGISEGRLLIGQSAVCKLRLSDPSVSRRHAALRRDDRFLRLTDIGSKNGTRVNGVRIQEAFLTGGEVIAVGNTTLRLTRVGATSSMPVHTSVGFGGFLSGPLALGREFTHYSSLARSDTPVLIEGEAGTGKELLAEAMHDASSRAGRPFVIFDCEAIAHASSMRVLLGDGAGEVRRAGLLEQARGGTLLIDEPTALDSLTQGELLSILEGGAHPVNGEPLDIRLITTSRRDLDREVQAGRFREDLLYRLAGAAIELPPLRHRPGDVELLAQTFWARLGGGGRIASDLLARYVDYDWPGNARELLHSVAARLSLETAPQGDEPREPTNSPPADVVTRVLAEELPFPRARQEVLRELEERFVEKVLAQHHGNVSKAAAASGLARRYFQIMKARRLPRS